MDDVRRLEQLIRAGRPLVLIGTHEERDALRVAREAAMAVSRNAFIWSYNKGFRNAIIEDETPLIEGSQHPAAAFHHVAHERDEGVWIFLDALDHLRDPSSDPGVLRALRDAVDKSKNAGRTIVLIDHTDRAPTVIESHGVRLHLAFPGDEEIEAIIRRTLNRLNTRDRPIQVSVNRRDLDTMIRNLRALTRRQIEQVITDAVLDDRRLHAGDLNAILAYKRQCLQADGLLEYIEAPASLDDIGGMENLKRWLRARELSLDTGAIEKGLTPPRGVLLLGVQGAGKSMCAKAIAAAWRRPLLRLDPGSLYDRYIGESERRLRQSLEQAERMAPIVLWIDEIEKGFASAASSNTDGGLSQRMFGALLTWMQEHTAPVFLVATANNIDALPPEMLRKGRFDEIFFVDLPGEAARREILSIHLRKRRHDPGAFDLDALSAASEGYSGAEIEQAIISAMHEAHAANNALASSHVEHALRTSPPLSVTMRERIHTLRAWAAGRCVPAD